MSRVPPLRRADRLPPTPATGVPASTEERSPHDIRVLFLLGRFEARRLCRNVVLLAAFVGAAVGIVIPTLTEVPVWWVWDIKIGTALLMPAGVLLVLAQLAAGRASRDEMQDLYCSYPSGAPARMGGHLLGLAGPTGLGVVLVMAAAVWLDTHGALGAPRLTVLMGAVLLVALGGALGIALGVWRPHPVAGLLALILLGVVEIYLTYLGGLPRVPPGLTWLFPWRQPDFLGMLPGPVPGIPAAGAHAAELAALTALAALAAIWPGARPRRLVAGVAAACLAAIGVSGWLQARPVPVSELSKLAADAMHPVAAERCTTLTRVRYCAYPNYLPEARLWAVPVGGVLARVPGTSGNALVVRQINQNDFLFSSSLTGINGYAPAASGRARQITRLDQATRPFYAALATSTETLPRPGDSPVYVGLSWGQGSALGASQFDLATLVAYQAVGLPTLMLQVPGGAAQCLADGQAREVIALWLAAVSTPAARAHFDAVLAHPSAQISVLSPYQFDDFTQYLGYPSRASVQLAAEMLRLPTHRVEAVLAARWARWRDWRTSAADLASALGIALPAGPRSQDAPPTAATVQGQPVCR